MKLRVLNFGVGLLTFDAAGCEVPEKVPLALGATFNFFNAIGEATLTKTADGIDAEFELPSWIANRIRSNTQEKLFPTVGGVVLENIGTKATKSRIVAVCLDKANNQDPGIEQIRLA